MTQSQSSGRGGLRTDSRLFTLNVFIIDGPISDAFLQTNPIISRTIQIRADQTLEKLHHTIFDAFDREDEHGYEFQISGDAPNDPKAKRYVLPGALHANDTRVPELPDDAPGSSDPETIHATIGSLNLQVEDIFGYWFDFGDDWWHQINVVSIADKAGKSKYPKISKRIGASPPQYMDSDEEDDADFDGEMDIEPYDPPTHLEKLKANVPANCVDRFIELINLIDAFCDAYLNAEYQMLSREMLAELYTQNVPMHRGKPQSWAAGILYIIGQANFLGDPSFEPYMKSEDLAKQMGVSIATAHAKAAIIRKAVEVSPLEPRWLISDHPAIQMMQGLMGQFLGALPDMDEEEPLNE